MLQKRSSVSIGNFLTRCFIFEQVVLIQSELYLLHISLLL